MKSGRGAVRGMMIGASVWGLSGWVLSGCGEGGGGGRPAVSDAGADAQLPRGDGGGVTPDVGVRTDAGPVPDEWPLTGEPGEVVWAVGLQTSEIDLIRSRLALPSGGQVVLMQAKRPMTVQTQAGRQVVLPAVFGQAGMLLRFDHRGRLAWYRTLGEGFRSNTFVDQAFLVGDEIVVEGYGSVTCEGINQRVEGEAWQCRFDATGALVGHRAIPRLEFPEGPQNAISGAWLVRDVDGAPVTWRQVSVPSSSRDWASALAADDGGGLVAAPFFEATTFGAGTPAERTLTPTVEGSTRSDLAIGRYAADGTLLWVRQLTGWNDYDVQAMTRMPDGDWLVAARAQSLGDDLRVERAPGDWVDIGGRPLAVLLCRYSDTGALRWVTPITASNTRLFGTRVHDLSPRVDGGFSITGSFVNGVAIGGRWDTATFSFDKGEDAHWLYAADFDADGQAIWASLVARSDTPDLAEGLRLTPNLAGQLLVTGRIGADAHGLSFTPAQEYDFLTWVGQVARGGPVLGPPVPPTADLGEACERAGAPGCQRGYCVAGECVECGLDLHCRDGQRCAGAVCVDGERGVGTAAFGEPCETDAAPVACGEGLVCLPDRNLCAECVDDGDCEGRACVFGECG